MAQKFSYEFFILFTSDILDKEKSEEKKSIKTLIESFGGKVDYAEFWELRKLAYRIKGKDEGYYLLMYFDVDSTKLTNIDKELLLNRKILRHMVTKVKDGYRFSPTKLEMVDFREREQRDDSRRGDDRRHQRPMRAAIPKIEKTEEKVEKPEIAEKKSEEIAVVETPKKKEVKAKKKESIEEKMQNLDKKLEDIVNNPDIMGI